jgi:hypothetical protein
MARMRFILRFIIAAVLGAIAYDLYPKTFFDIPFSQLSLGNIVKLIGAVLFGIAAIKTFFGFD